MDVRELDNLLREKTKAAVAESAQKWRQRAGRVEKPTHPCLHFFGTGGNPEANIGQNPRTAGFLVNLGEAYLWIDPGPGALASVNEHHIDLGSLDAVYISHGHVDHYANAEILVEGMCWAMSTRRGLLLGPESVFTEKLISTYHQGETTKHGYLGGPEVRYLKTGEPIAIKDVILTPTPAYHGGENYGFIIEYGGFKLGYTSDTNYIRSYRTSQGIQEMQRMGPIMDFEEVVDYRQDVKAAYQDVDVLIANVTTHNSWAHRHITTLGLAHLLQGSKVKTCYLSHFNYCCVDPVDLREQMSEYVTRVSGITTFPAYDDLQIDLSPYIAKE